MRGEVKGERPKRCLSRNKRSKPEKSSENDCNSDETASGIYTAVRSKQPALVHPDEKSDQLGLLALESTDDTSSISDNCGEGGFTATTSIGHQSDAFDFCDNEVIFDESKYIKKSCSYKRKRIDSEELEPSGFTNIVSKFKRSRSALNNLKQPSICLENCKDVNAGSQSGRNRTDTPTDKNKQGTCIEHLSTAKGYLHHDQLLKVDNITVDGLSTVNNKVGNVHDGKTIDDTKPQDNSEDCSRNQVCPVCSFKFLPKDEMDVINEHINSCLDNGCDSSNKQNVLPETTCDDIGEELFFCQLCQKDLSRMNSQRRQQHVNRCCDQAGKAEEMPPSSTVTSQLQCPICGKGFKSSKSCQSHLKKCTQEFNVGTNQLLEIVNREKQKEESNSSAARTEVNTALSANVQPARNSTGVKRKRRGATHERDLDEETQLALALSASMAPPLPPATQIRKGGRGKGKKNQGGSELPALLLRDDKTAQRAVALRAAQVLCTQEGNDEDEEISCTPALAPSRLAQNIPSCQPVEPVRKEMESEDLVDDLDSKVDDATESDHKMEEDNLMDVDNGNESEEVLRKSAGVTAVVDPLLSRSFFNSLCDVDFEESQPAEMKTPQTGHLWSLAAAKDESSTSFYVPGLLPPTSPRRQKKLPIIQFAALESPAKESIVPKKCHKQVDDNAESNKVSRHEATQESVAQLQLTTTENDEPPEITPSQAANVEMLLELVGEDDISNVSINSQQVITATCNGFCIDEQEEEDKECVTVPSGVSKLLEDLSSMINNSHLSDVVINLKDGQEIAAHSFILSLRSEVLAQLLKERKALQEKTESGGKIDRVALMFQEITRSAFEVVLKHIYTGDVIIPEHCELDDVINLAERFRLPCLLTACKKAQLRLKQALENLDEDETDDYIVTNVARVEQDLWRSYNDDDTSENVQTTKNKYNEDEDDFLNDDDIEEIMIFQTQSLQRKTSERGMDEREDEKSQEEVISTGLACIHTPSKFCEDISGDKPSFLAQEEMVHMFGKPLKDDALSHRPFEEGKVPRSPWKRDSLSGGCLEEGNVSRFHVEEDTMPCNHLEKDNVSDSPVDEGSVSRNRVEENNLARNSRGNGANVAEEEVSCPKEHVIEEDVIIKYAQSPLREDSAIRKQLRNKRDCCEGNQLFLCDENVISHASSRERVCIQEAELISDSDDVEAQPEDLMHESTERHAVKRDLGKSYGVDKEVSQVEETAEVGFELQNDVDCIPIHNVSADLLNGENEVGYGDFEEKDVSEKIQDTLADMNPIKNGHVNRCLESSKTFSNEPISLPSGDGGWDDEEVFQGSPGEITVPCDVESDDEMEEMALNESITLISDNEEEVLDVSPPKTDITIVPETPGVRGRISTKSSSTLSVTEEDDVTVTGSSPSKSRKQLTEEANEFLSKLKQRAERGKGKRQGEKPAKKNCGGKRSPVEIPPKQTTPTKSSPVKNQEAQVGRSPLSPARHSNPLTASPMQMSPRGSKSPSVSPTWMFPRVCNSPGVVAAQTSRVCKSSICSLMQTPPGKSPRGFNPRSVSPIAVDECCVSDVVTNHVIGNCPPVWPDLHQPHDLPQTSQTEEKGRESLGEKEFDYGEPNDVEIIEACVDRTEDRICEGLALSPSSSPPDVMSPPVPSPSYSFLDHVSSPGSPVPYASPMPEKSVLLADRVSPSSPLDWKSPEKNLESRVHPNSPISPSVCSYRQHVVRDLCSQDSRKDAVDFERRLNDKEKPKNVEVVEIDRNLPLMERLKAARGGGHKIFSLGEDKDVCDKNSDDCTRSNVETGENRSPISSQREKVASSQKEMNASISAEFDFHDDGGFIFGVDELNNLEDGLENDDNVMTREEGNSKELSNQCKVMARKKGPKEVPGKRKIPPSQRRVQDSDDDDRSQQVPSKRGKKTDTQPTKHAGQTVVQPVTPMPNYNEMATPTLKNELHKFGVRPLPKKRMILKLKEIYDYTHQVEPRPQGSKAERAPSKDQPLSSNVAVSETAGGVEGSGTASSDNSDEEDTEFGDCTVMIEDEVITASQQVNGGNLKERLVHYFGDNEELYKKVLRYQPLELVSLQQQIKSDGINCPLGKLVDFLDQQCVTFTTAGSRPRAPKKRGRKKKN